MSAARDARLSPGADPADAASSTVPVTSISPEHTLVLNALREESEVLYRINRRIVELGGEPIAARRTPRRPF